MGAEKRTRKRRLKRLKEKERTKRMRMGRRRAPMIPKRKSSRHWNRLSTNRMLLALRPSEARWKQHQGFWPMLYLPQISQLKKVQEGKTRAKERRTFLRKSLTLLKIQSLRRSVKKMGKKATYGEQFWVPNKQLKYKLTQF